MRHAYTILEFGLIRRLSDAPGSVSSPAELFLPDTAFDALKQLASEPDVEGILSFSLRKGREILRAKNYVGLLETRSGVQLEILPKITVSARLNDADADRSAQAMRLALLRMVQHLRNSPFRQVGTAHQQAARLPLWEVLITAFLNEVTPLMAQGLPRAYVSTGATLPVVRGKLQIAEQMRRNTYHAERFAVEYDDFTADIPPNRLLKACLLLVKSRTRTLSNQTHIRQLLFALDDVPASVRIESDLKASQTDNRLLGRYAAVLRWTGTLLLHQAFGIPAGQHLNMALLFPMERVFEEYVAAGFRRAAQPGDELTIQGSSAYLIDEHAGESTPGGPRFRLRPDILLRRNGECVLLDTKWKPIDGRASTGTYGIEQADLYQLYAYGKKYEATRLVLIYPASETFTRPLNLFGYDPTLPLYVVPFDVTNPLADEVETVLKLTLSSRSAS